MITLSALQAEKCIHHLSVFSKMWKSIENISAKSSRRREPRQLDGLLDKLVGRNSAAYSASFACKHVAQYASLLRPTFLRSFISSSTIMPRIRLRPQSAGSKPIPTFICTSRRPRLPGSTWSSGSSPRSPENVSAAAPSSLSET